MSGALFHAERRRTMHRGWARAITDDGVGVTPWEEEFVESVSAQLEHGRSLTDKQAEILERIYSERTP